MTSHAHAVASPKINILMLSHSSGEKDQRIVRAAEAAVEAGHSVTVLGIRSYGYPGKQVLNGVTFLRVGAQQPPGDTTTFTPSRFARLASLAARALLGPAAYLLIRNSGHYVRFARANLKPDIVHAHDLYTLYAGWRIARRTGAKLIYDAHELETGRAGVTGRIDKLVRRLSERYLIKRVDAVITVSDSIADYMADDYGIDRPTVIHNAPRGARVDSISDVRTTLMIPPGHNLAVYVGGITFDRGLVQIVKAMPSLPDLHVALVGPRKHAPIEKRLRGLAGILQVDDRLHFVDPVPASEVTGFIRTADVSLVLIQDSCLSYRFSFPNKLLESLFAGLPIVASMLPEYEALIRKTNAGVVVDQSDPMSIAAGIRTVLANNRLYAPQREMLANLEKEYGWQTQGQRLCSLYVSVAAANNDKPYLSAGPLTSTSSG